MTARVHHNDCLKILARTSAESVDLIYADPPFFTQKTHKLTTRDRSREFSFEDLWSSHADYATFLHDRFCHLHRVLKISGSIFVHCDRNATHIVRALLDGVFGQSNFRSEIIWHYRRWSNSQKSLLPAHQTIYFYTKSDEYTFKKIFEDYSPSTNVDQILQGRKRDEHGKSVYDRDEVGNIRTNPPKKGVPLGDVWDIPYLNPKAKERTGYPTQKPILLLERIIRLASNPGDQVLDPFCGSGTTLVAAQFIGRNSTGIDTSTDAVELTRKRLSQPKRTASRLLETGRDAYRQANGELLGLLYGLSFHPVQRNKGIDAILEEQYQSSPVPVRIQRPGETLTEAATALDKASKGKNASLKILIATHRKGQLPFTSVPHDILVVEAPALTVAHQLQSAT